MGLCAKVELLNKSIERKSVNPVFHIKLEKDDFKMRNKELNLTQFETLSDEELQKIEGGYLPIPDMPGWRGQSTPWWWSLKQSNFSDAYSSFYNATH